MKGPRACRPAGFFERIVEYIVCLCGAVVVVQTASEIYPSGPYHRIARYDSRPTMAVQLLLYHPHCCLQ